MSKIAEVGKMARLALSRQFETDMRVDAVEARAGEAADAAASAGGRTPPPAAAPSLDGLYGWRPEAFSVWFTTGGGGKVGVSFPEKCVSYNGNHMDDGVLTPAVQEDPETKFRWCELPAPQEAEPKLVLTLLVELDGATHEPGDEVTVAYLEWAVSVDAAKARHAETDRKVVACVPVAEYDAKLDRLAQVHVGALALGGGGGGGGGDEFLHPFEVRWSQSQSEGQGAWVIWLPSPGSLVNYNGAWLTFSGTSAASGLPAGWVRAQGVSASATAVYLLVVTPPGQTSKRAMFASSSSASGVTVHFSALVATMSVDATTGARSVKQIVDSSVIIGAGGGDVNLDDVSTDYNGDTEVQVKDWDTGTPAASTTIAQDIHDGNATAQAAVVSRTTGGALQYKKPGTLEELTGSSVNVSSYPIITGVTWDGTNHQLVISSVQVTIANGIITAWNANRPTTIETTSISSILGS